MLSGFENPVHLLMLFGVVLLLFGAKRLPELGKSLGTGLREFKSSIAAATETESPEALRSSSRASTDTDR